MLTTLDLHLERSIENQDAWIVFYIVLLDTLWSFHRRVEHDSLANCTTFLAVISVRSRSWFMSVCSFVLIRSVLQQVLQVQNLLSLITSYELPTLDIFRVLTPSNVVIFRHIRSFFITSFAVGPSAPWTLFKDFMVDLNAAGLWRRGYRFSFGSVQFPNTSVSSPFSSSYLYRWSSLYRDMTPTHTMLWRSTIYIEYRHISHCFCQFWAFCLPQILKTFPTPYEMHSSWEVLSGGWKHARSQISMQSWACISQTNLVQHQRGFSRHHRSVL